MSHLLWINISSNTKAIPCDFIIYKCLYKSRHLLHVNCTILNILMALNWTMYHKLDLRRSENTLLPSSFETLHLNAVAYRAIGSAKSTGSVRGLTRNYVGCWTNGAIRHGPHCLQRQNSWTNIPHRGFWEQYSNLNSIVIHCLQYLIYNSAVARVKTLSVQSWKTWWLV